MYIFTLFIYLILLYLLIDFILFMYLFILTSLFNYFILFIVLFVIYLSIFILITIIIIVMQGPLVLLFRFYLFKVFSCFAKERRGYVSELHVLLRERGICELRLSRCVRGFIPKRCGHDLFLPVITPLFVCPYIAYLPDKVYETRQ